MAEPTNVFKELRDILKEFKDFLSSDTVAKVKAVIQALAALIPKIKDLIGELIKLLDKLKAAIEKLDLKNIPELGKATEFTAKVTNLLSATKALLPELLPDNEANDVKGTIDEALKLATVATSLDSSFDQIKLEILSLLKDIKDQLESMKPS